MDIPILRGHDPAQAIGKLHVVDGRMFCEFVKDVEISRDQLFDIFGGAGIRILESQIGRESKVLTITKGEILEFSLPMGTKA